MPGSRQTVSSLLTPRESHPAAPHSTASREYHCLPCGLSRKESGTARYFKSVVVARCRLAGRGAPLHTLFYLRSARGKYLTNDVQFSKYSSLLIATLIQQLVRSFLTPSLNSRWEGLFFPSVPLQFTNCLHFSFQSFQSASNCFFGCAKMYRNISY